jgi:hypothetical protein
VSPRHREKGRRYRIAYAESAVEHVKRLLARDRATVVEGIDERLSFDPNVETRNRKRMDENTLEAEFEFTPGRAPRVLCGG